MFKKKKKITNKVKKPKNVRVRSENNKQSFIEKNYEEKLSQKIMRRNYHRKL